MFMGRWIRHGGHYPAWHLRLMRTGAGRCEDRLYDQHFYVSGAVQKLQGDLIDTLTPDVATFTARHLAVGGARGGGARSAARMPPGEFVDGSRPTTRSSSVGGCETGTRGCRCSFGPTAYFLYRYFVRLGFLDGRAGLVFHVLQGFWFRFLVDALILERRLRRKEAVAAKE